MLINIPYYHADATLAPLGLAYLAAVLEEKGANFLLVDANAAGMDDEAIVSLVEKAGPALVGFSVMTSMVVSARRIAEKIRSLPAPPLVVFGGPHPTVRPEETLRTWGADLCVRGEGELTIAELSALRKQGPGEWGAIKGLSFINDGEVVHTQDRPLIENLDTVPYPAYHLLPMEKYTTLHTGKKLFAPLMTSRGCPGRCMFCSRCVFGRRVRYRSIPNILGEIRMLLDNFVVDEISVLDDAFISDRERIIELCRAIRSNGLEFAWRLGNGARVDQVEEEVLSEMKAAGCYEVAFGVESGDDGVLRKIGKEITTDQVRRAFGAAQKVGLDTIGFFMLGHPFDTVETMEKTIDFAMELKPTFAQFCMSTPLPGTALWSWVERRGKSLIDGDVTRLDFLGGTPHFETENFSREEATAMYRRAYRRFYLRPSYIWRNIRAIHSWNDILVRLKGALYLRKL